MLRQTTHYDFIEIGTSDFDTIIQSADDQTNGLSIEPLSFYLNRLPNKKNVKKVQLAISDKDDIIDIYYISEDKIIEYELPYWVRGCNSVGGPHDYARNQIGKELYDKLVTIEKVNTMCWETLISTYNIGSIGHLKIDTEGHDHIILKNYLESCKNNPLLLADKIEFECNEISNKKAIDEILSDLVGYSIEKKQYDIVLTKKHEKAYLLYASESYFNTVQACVNSINAFSNIPVFVYMLNSDAKVNGATTIRWDCDVENIPHNQEDNFYIDRADYRVFRLLIERPMVVKDCLKYAKKIAYVDSDSVATRIVDSIFDFQVKDYPLFVEGIYDWLHIEGRGGAESRDDLSTTLEASACELFGVDQNIRERYRQTGYFLVNEDCADFLDEWYWMCNHPKILQDFKKYAPYHEETIANVLLWKKKILDGLPYIYTNASEDLMDKIYNELEFDKHHSSWFRLPKRNELLFFHGEKRADIMNKMITKMKPLKILFVAPHLSTGGMPSYLLKRIQCLKRFYPELHIEVVEFSNYSPDFVVQKNKLQDLVYVHTLEDDKMELMDIVKHFDVVHFDELIEGFDTFNQVPKELQEALYAEDRTWKMVETCHNVWFEEKNKVFHPDAYAFCTPYHETTFSNTPSYSEVFEFPIDLVDIKKTSARFDLGFDLYKKHVINVGLWTEGKNQKEGVEIARKYPNIQFHFIGNQAPNFKSYWEPIMKDLPSNVKVWGEREDIDCFMQAADIFMFNSTWECNPLVLREAISYGLPIIARNLPQYVGMFDKYIQPIDTDLNTIKANYEIPRDNTSEIFAKKMFDFYNKVFYREPIEIIHHFVGNPFLEIKGKSKSSFDVQFFDADKLVYSNTIGSNNWVKLNREYYTDWNTKVYRNGTLVYDHKINFENSKVYIALESKSLGDTIAWVPYALEFKKKHKCNVVVSTFWNHMFDYPELEFVEPGTLVNNIIAMYKIGWFYDENREPQVPHTIPMQKAATNILGLDYTEIKPKMKCKEEEKIKQVCIGIHSTAQAKYWNNQGEWQKLVDWLIDKGYVVKLISKEGEEYMGNVAPKGVVHHPSGSIESVINELQKSVMFIGIGSGLSWLSWALDVPTVLISGFSEPFAEMEGCIRISAPEGKCSGCFNRYRLNAGDWNWCPDHKDTDRQFECTKSITAQMVIDQISSMY